MEWLDQIAIRIIAAVALLYFGLGLFNIPWLMRFRILASLGVGALIVGALGYVFVRPEDPLGAICLFTGQISAIDAIILIILGLLAGAAATVICYPIGNILGHYAAPAGLAVLALFNGGVTQLLLTHDTFPQRSAMYNNFRIGTLLWLAVCAAGAAGVYIATKITHKKAQILHPEAVPQEKAKTGEKWSNMIGAVLIAAVVVYFLVGVFVRDIRQFDDQLKYVVGCPGSGQIAFGVFVSVGVAAFLNKRFMQAHYLATIAGVAAMYLVLLTRYSGSEKLNYMVEHWPIYFFPHALYAIIPIQLVSYSVLGAMTGYWAAIRMMQKPAEEQ